MKTFSLAVLIVGWIAATYVLWLDLRTAVFRPRPIAPKKPSLVVTVCEGCGCEWESYDGHRDRIKKCPNCPMSEEEFERLKEEMRKRRIGDST